MSYYKFDPSSKYPHQYKYTRPSVASTVVPLTIGSDGHLHVLLGKRSSDSDAFPDCWALFGGFLNEGQETVEDTAVRELLEELGLNISKESLRFLYVSSKPGVDPRSHVVNICYSVMLDRDQVNSMVVNEEHSEVKWVRFCDIEKYPLAFDHANIVYAVGEY